MLYYLNLGLLWTYLLSLMWDRALLSVPTGEAAAHSRVECGSLALGNVV